MKLNKLLESPDGIEGYFGEKTFDTKWQDDDAYTFGYLEGKFKAKKSREGFVNTTHHNLFKGEVGIDLDRYYLKYPGRIWLESKIMSLWGEYPNQNDFKKLIDDLERELHKSIWNNDFYIETLDSNNDINIVPIEEFAGKSKEHINVSHIDDPIEKERKRKILTKQGKLKVYHNPKYANMKITPAEYNFYKDKNIAELRSLIREMIKEELLPNKKWKRNWIGSYGKNMMGPVDVYKNPNSIRNFNIGSRVITVPNGDLYIVDDPFKDIIHHDIIEYLKYFEGYNVNPETLKYWNSGLNKLFIGWVKTDNKTLKLSESTNMDWFEKYYEEDPKFVKYIENLKQKHSNIKFILEKGYDR